MSRWFSPPANRIRRRWSSWEQADDRKVWMRKKKDRDKEVVVDLVENFFTRLNL